MNILVTGGGGFLGKAIIEMLLEKRHTVRSFSRGDYPELRQMGVETRRGDLADFSSVDQAVSGCDAVFHAGAKAGVSVDYESFFKSNVLGTQNVVDACKRRTVSKLIYTSSPSITFDGKDQEGVDESTPVPKKFMAHYPRTKAAAEALVLAANSETLSTVALRPHLIWGPGDTQITPRVIERAKAGRLRLVGSGQKLVDATYIDNAAHAHILAFDRLEPNAACAGKAYYISNNEPMAFAEVMNGILAAAGLDPVSKRISPSLAYYVGAALETIYRLRGSTDEPQMTRFVARQLSTAHWYDIRAAKRDLGYQPIVSMEQGMHRLAMSLEEGAHEERATA